MNRPVERISVIPEDDALASSRWEKVRRRVAEKGVGELPRWAVEWFQRKGHRGAAAAAVQLERLQLEFKYRRRTKKLGIENPIVIYQMGKVASQSLYYSLKALDLDVPIFHAHALNRLDEYEVAVRAKYADPRKYLLSIDSGRAIRREVDSKRWGGWDLITVVRTPIPRSISEFFENLETHVPQAWERTAQGTLTVRELQEYYLHRYQDTSPLSWFEDQVRDPFNIDVYATEFDKRRGYQTYAQKPIRLLIVRIENLDECVRPALHEFLGLETFTLIKFNEGVNKYYAELYREFLQTLRLPADFIAKMHGTRYAQHFYTPEELEASVRDWRATPDLN